MQLMYLRERLKNLPPGRFVEIGPGSGEITKLLLATQWSGTVYDLSDEATRMLRQRFSPEIIAGKLTVVLGDFLDPTTVPQQEDRADMIISCMVMEHLDGGAERNFMERSRTMLKTGGRMIGLVPASPRHWGIEDDVAGYYRRYSRNSLSSLLGSTGWKLEHVAGLTYPVSNCLLSVSNYLVKRKEEANSLLRPSNAQSTPAAGTCPSRPLSLPRSNWS